ncbi:addiction module protein [Aquisalimonas sp.]|uniref:addiction module protein n=1 Tax=Aquisalimonas sp. TaxID=1872621 RepID=UPI0025BD7557|nr:addiction module protein [Aquisalimonas sp.]
MSIREKLSAMEALWDDLARDPDSVPVPAWHQEVLEERGLRAETGGTSFSEWESTKDRVRERTR